MLRYKGCQAKLDAYVSDSDKAEKFIALVRRYTNFEELTGAMINELIERVEVYEGGWNGSRPGDGNVTATMPAANAAAAQAAAL